eukprot:EG_transcript_22178
MNASGAEDLDLNAISSPSVTFTPTSERLPAPSSLSPPTPNGHRDGVEAGAGPPASEPPEGPPPARHAASGLGASPVQPTPGPFPSPGRATGPISAGNSDDEAVIADMSDTRTPVLHLFCSNVPTVEETTPILHVRNDDHTDWLPLQSAALAASEASQCSRSDTDAFLEVQPPATPSPQSHGPP